GQLRMAQARVVELAPEVAGALALEVVPGLATAEAEELEAESFVSAEESVRHVRFMILSRNFPKKPARQSIRVRSCCGWSLQPMAVHEICESSVRSAWAWMKKQSPQ